MACPSPSQPQRSRTGQSIGSPCMAASRVRPAARVEPDELGIGTVERGGLRQVGVDDDGREGLARRRFGQCARFDVKGRILESVEGEAGFPNLLGAAFGCVIVGLHRAVDLVADRGAEKRSVGIDFLGEFETDARAGRGVAQLQAAPAGQVFPRNRRGRAVRPSGSEIRFTQTGTTSRTGRSGGMHCGSRRVAGPGAGYSTTACQSA